MTASTTADSLQDHLGRWAASVLSCQETNRDAAEEGIKLAYSVAGLKPPQKIIWHSGPLAIADDLASIVPRDPIGKPVKYEICDLPKSRADLFREIVQELGEDQDSVPFAPTAFEACALTCEGLQRVVVEAADSQLQRAGLKASHTLRRLRGLPTAYPRQGFASVAIGPSDLVHLGVYKFLYERARCSGPFDPLEGLWLIAENASWIAPFEHVCWVAERPRLVAYDARGRLHSASGPAVAYRDGWAAYAWKGISVPPWTIVQPELIMQSTLAEIADPVLRNCLIEIMGLERFVRVCSAQQVSRDETGILWRKQWNYRGVMIAEWAGVEVVNGTAGPSGSVTTYVIRVPSRLRSAREAVAWTYGMTADQYRGLALRT